MNKMLRATGRNKGFTLIELIIVLAVLGILAAIVVPNVAGYIEQGKQRSLNADRAVLQAAIDSWRTDTANRVGNQWPTVGGVKGTVTDGNSDGDFVDAASTGDINSIISITSLTDSSSGKVPFLKSTDTVKSFKYATAVTGATGATNSPVGSYYWYIDGNGVVTSWYDADDDKVIDTGETGYYSGVYP